MQTHRHLLHLFKLCCLCATSSIPDHPAVTLGRIRTLGYQNRFTDVILPSQSYLSAVPGSIAFCSNETNLGSFSLLSASFGQSAFSTEYDPWTYVDVFGWGKMYKSLISSYRAVVSAPAERTVVSISVAPSTIRDAPAVQPPGSNKRRKMERGSSGSRASAVTKEADASTSKLQVYICIYVHYRTLNFVNFFCCLIRFHFVSLIS